MLPTVSALPKPTPRSFTHGTLPPFVDERQPPQKRQPFGSLHRQQCVYAIDLIVPDELVDGVRKRLDEGNVNIKYAKVIMSLGDILSGDFFTRYVKIGNVMMMSEGKRGLDPRFEMFDGAARGVLRIEVDKATYERAGLSGTTIPDGGVKHAKNRYAIEVNLHQPSMLHGKKGFERIMWASRNVFNQSLTWLFHDLTPDASVGVAHPIDAHHPRWFVVQSATSHLASVRVPKLTDSVSPTLLESLSNDSILASDLEEWVSLIALKSPRIQVGDNPDAFICRYAFPTEDPVIDRGELDQVTTATDLTVISWRGFIPSSFVLHTLLVAKRASKNGGWWLISSKGLRRDQDIVTILQQSKQEDGSTKFLSWHNSK